MNTDDLKDKADEIFSQYIRLRDSDDNGYGRCIACGKIVFWKDADNGHYINRQHMSLRYDERNCNFCCKDCNQYRDGNLIGYSHGLVEKYGDGIIDYLNVMKHTVCKMGRSDYIAIIGYCKKMIAKLKQEKGI